MSLAPSTSPRTLRRPDRPKLDIALVLAGTLAVAGCGGGGNPVPGDTVVDGSNAGEPIDVDGPSIDTGDEPGDGSVHGTLRLERRADKLTADAWFVPLATSATEPPARTSDRGDDCTLESVALDAVVASVAPSPGAFAGEAPPVRSTLAAATRLVATARTGEYLVLEPSRLGAHVAYATEARWIRDPLPDDLSLATLGEDGTTLFDPVPLRTVPDPTVLVPANGRLDTLSTALAWSPPPPDAGTHARLVLSGWRAARDGAREDRLTTIRCLLEDDGEFLVPASLRAEAGEASGGWTARLARERRTVVERDGSRLEIVQSVLP